MKIIANTTPLLLCLALIAGCQSAITPLQSPPTLALSTDSTTQPATAAATAPATQTAATQTAATQTAATQAAATQAASRPSASAHTNPDQTTRVVYLASYDNIWRQATELLKYYNYRLDVQDYRRGVITTLPLGQAQISEIWRRDGHGLTPAVEAMINHQRVTLRLFISAIPGKPDFYQISSQALVERESNPDEVINPASSVTAFGASTISTRSDYDSQNVSAAYWTLLGHDRRMEKKVLDDLFKKI